MVTGEIKCCNQLTYVSNLWLMMQHLTVDMLWFKLFWGLNFSKTVSLFSFVPDYGNESETDLKTMDRSVSSYLP